MPIKLDNRAGRQTVGLRASLSSFFVFFLRVVVFLKGVCNTFCGSRAIARLFYLGVSMARKVADAKDAPESLRAVFDRSVAGLDPVVVAAGRLVCDEIDRAASSDDQRIRKSGLELIPKVLLPLLRLSGRSGLPPVSVEEGVSDEQRALAGRVAKLDEIRASAAKVAQAS
jgi:hypothetical protein